jgi:hypothetical protein
LLVWRSIVLWFVCITSIASMVLLGFVFNGLKIGAF